MRRPTSAKPEDGGVTFEGRIREQYAGLPESERRIADLILEFPGDLAAYSATELAALSGGSKAAVTRLVKRLGFANFDEARRAARSAQAWGSPLYLMSKNSAGGNFGARVSAHVEQDFRNIAVSLETLNPQTFNEIVDGICTARRVFLLGYRNSYYLAGYTRWQIIQVRGDVYLLPAAGETVAEEIADLTDQDMVIVIGFRRRVAAVRPTMAGARALGARVLYITDWSAEPAPDATWTLRCAVRGSDLFDRYASAMSLLHFLSVSVVDRLGARGRARLQRVEDLHRDLREFD
ncbi:MAG: MurR/RpiR family transcriptional regulator [Rhodobacterales bacterium]|nr:MurR/RpiR family transcriptional regulator [Rhodobacterales bacterium]